MGEEEFLPRIKWRNLKLWVGAVKMLCVCARVCVYECVRQSNVENVIPMGGPNLLCLTDIFNLSSGIIMVGKVLQSR